MIIRINKTQLRRELFVPEVLVISGVFSLLYVFFSSLIMNHQLITETLRGDYSFNYKVTILLSLARGVGMMYSLPELLLLLTIGLLMGMNLVLITKSLKEKKQNGDWSLGIGLLGAVATTGCASCGITLFSLAGPTLSLSFLPFQSFLLQLISMGLLALSLIHTLNRRGNSCVIVAR
jgi:hypothetical protein